MANRKITAEFVVVKHSAELLSCKISKDLGVPKTGLQVNSRSEYQSEYRNLITEHEGIFHGVGLLKDRIGILIEIYPQ